ncbi:hypothetical protein [Salana multivorans]
MPSPVPSAHSRSTGFAPWTAVGDDASGPDSAVGPANQGRLAALRSRGHEVDPTAYVADEAVVDADHLTLGARSYLAAQTHVTGDVTIGADCSLNVFAAARGRVRIGNGVRIGASTSILGFDHEFADPDLPVRRRAGLRPDGAGTLRRDRARRPGRTRAWAADPGRAPRAAHGVVPGAARFRRARGAAAVGRPRGVPRALRGKCARPSRSTGSGAATAVGRGDA